MGENMGRKNEKTLRRLRTREKMSISHLRKSKSPLDIDKLDELLNSLDAMRKYANVK